MAAALLFLATTAGAAGLFLQDVEVQPPQPVLRAAVQQQLGLWVGDPLQAADLADARERLLESGWFETVEVYARPGSRRGAVVLHVDVELDRRPHFESGFGHEPLDGWYLDVAGLRVQHLGRVGSRLNLSYQTGLRRREFLLDFELPRMLGPLDLLLEARGGEKDWNVFSGDVFLQQTIDESRAGLGLRWRATSTLSTSLWWRHGRSDPRSLHRQDESDDPVPFASLPGDSPAIEFGELRWSLVYDRRAPDRSYRRGFYAAMRAHSGWIQNGPRFGGAEVEMRGNVPLGETSGLSLRIGASATDPATPYQLRPIFGGLASVRGYRNASLSGPFGARGTVSASAEFLTPLLPRGTTDPRLLGVLFVDAGNFADDRGEWSDGALGVGWGLRVKVPWIDHIALDVGLPLSPTGTSDPFWIHLGLGVGF
jgi:outer membrane protein assembly factor BamA